MVACPAVAASAKADGPGGIRTHRTHGLSVVRMPGSVTGPNGAGRGIRTPMGHDGPTGPQPVPCCQFGYARIPIISKIMAEGERIELPHAFARPWRSGPAPYHSGNPPFDSHITSSSPCRAEQEGLEPPSDIPAAYQFSRLAPHPAGSAPLPIEKPPPVSQRGLTARSNVLQPSGRRARRPPPPGKRDSRIDKLTDNLFILFSCFRQWRGRPGSNRRPLA